MWSTTLSSLACKRAAVMPKQRDPDKYPQQLKGSAFTVKGEEPLSKKPISVRLFQSDDDTLRPLGKEMAIFIRAAVREKLERNNK